MGKICTKCGLAIPSEKRKTLPMCQECKWYKRYTKTYAKTKDANKKAGVDLRNKRGKVWEKARYEEWLILIKHVPKDYPRLTEAQWHETVKYFDYKCAMCQDNPVYSRHYFVARQDGGMYCNWNIIPVCEHCIDQSQKNPFRAMNHDTQRDSRIQTNTHGYGKRKLKKILDYLTPLLLKAISQNNSQQSTDTNNGSVIS